MTISIIVLWHGSRVTLIFKNLISEPKFLLQEIEMTLLVESLVLLEYHSLLPILYYIYVTGPLQGSKIPKERDRVWSTSARQ